MKAVIAVKNAAGVNARKLHVRKSLGLRYEQSDASAGAGDRRERAQGAKQAKASERAPSRFERSRER